MMMHEGGRLSETLVAFANTNGGSLSVDVFQREAVEQIAAHCQPPLVLDVQVVGDCLTLTVPQSTTLHATPDGRVWGYSRMGAIELDGAGIRQLATMRGLGNFEMTPVPGVGADDLDLPAPPDQATVAQVVMYAYHPQQWLPQAQIMIQQWVGKRKVSQQALNGPLPHLLEQAEVSIGDLAIPQPVIREALINALIHRDYRLPQPITIDMHAQYLDIISPGEPPAFVPLQSMGRHQYRRNPSIAQGMEQLGYRGVSLEHVYTLMAQAGYPQPSVDLLRNQLRLRLYRNATRTTPSTAVLNERQERALAYLREHGSITQRAYGTLCPDTAPPVLNQELLALEQLGILTRIGELAYVLEQSWT